MYSNLGSLPAKFDEFSQYVTSTNPTFILISETWLNDNIPDTLISIQNYSIYRQDRPNRRGGGVCIYVANEIDNFKISAEPNIQYDTGEISSLWLNIKISQFEFLLSCVYRPPSSPAQADELLLTTITNVNNHSKPVLIFGDFNYPDID